MLGQYVKRTKKNLGYMLFTRAIGWKGLGINFWLKFIERLEFMHLPRYVRLMNSFHICQ